MNKLNFFSFKNFSPEKNMQIDNRFLRKKDGFYFRLYGWKPAGVSIGISQAEEKVCNAEYCREKGIPIVKRITGGGAVYHKNDITYMFSAPLNYFADKSVVGIYREVASVLMKAFSLLGIQCQFAGEVKKEVRRQGMKNGIACFLLPSDYEILVNGKKIVGNALRVERGRILQHGSIAYSFDYRETAVVLNTDAEKLKKRVVSLKELNPSLGIPDVEKAFLQSFSEMGFEIDVKKLSSAFNGDFF